MKKFNAILSNPQASGDDVRWAEYLEQTVESLNPGGVYVLMIPRAIWGTNYDLQMKIKELGLTVTSIETSDDEDTNFVTMKKN